MPSVGLGGITRGGVRMVKRGVASRLYGGEYGVNLHFLAGFLFFLCLLVLGQEEVQDVIHHGGFFALLVVYALPAAPQGFPIKIYSDLGCLRRLLAACWPHEQSRLCEM